MDNSIVISVNTIAERDIMIRELYETLTEFPSKLYTIQKDRVNRIKVFYNKKNLRLLINTYIVVVLPILLDFSPLENIYGTVEFRLDSTIDRLLKLTHKLQTLQGKQSIEGKVGAELLRKTLTKLF